MIKADGIPPTVFLIDFGLARLFHDPATCLHHPYTMGYSIVGTLPFTSINGQQGSTQSRRDNLESLMYTIIYLVCGDLPWSYISTSRDHKAVLQKKQSITAEELCEGLPTPFYKFVTHIHSLGFDKKPDYQKCHSNLSWCLGTKFDQSTKAPPFSAPSLVGVDCTPIVSSCM